MLLNEAKLGYVTLNTPMPCPPRGTVPVYPQAWFRAFVSTQHARFAFGKGCDRVNDVARSFVPLQTELEKPSERRKDEATATESNT